MARTQIQGNRVFNNKIKTKINKNHPEGEKQAGRQAGNCLHSQHYMHTMKYNGSAQDYRHQEAIEGDKRG